MKPSASSTVDLKVNFSRHTTATSPHSPQRTAAVVDTRRRRHPPSSDLKVPIFHRERSNYWKCVYCSLAWVPEAFHVQFPVLVKSSKVTRFAAHVFSLRPKTCRPVADKTKLPVTRKKKPLVPRVTVYRLTSA